MAGIPPGAYRRLCCDACTNLDVDDAKWYYKFSRIGDVVAYPNASSKVMPSWDGYGWWNLPWSVWSQGDLSRNH